MGDVNSIKLRDLIELETLQKVQDSFSVAVGMGACIYEADGTPITRGSGCSEFCMKYTRGSEVGASMCEECDRFGIEEAFGKGQAISYYCHAGLVDFVAPIIAENRIIGSVIGGQVFTEEPNEEEIRELARELGIDEDIYWEAACKIPIVSQDKVDSAKDFMGTIANILSEMALNKFITANANEELARAAKTEGDFLANMSHEIRTPMNAVIGFAEMALREDINETARGYIEQIKSSGNALLTIINDILDFSKIEAGKMDIIPVEYEPLSLIDDIANIITTRIIDKDVELLVDVAPNIPSVLYGDNIRLRQILINICNNATKFTEKGYVKLKAEFEWADYENVILRFSIEDTGIGIKQEDLDKIFNSFQQVDSKRNRNIEGTGLGLTICRNLLGLMGSELEVESEYGKGSIFRFGIKQKVVDSLPSIIVENPDKIYIAGVFSKDSVRDDFINDSTKLGLKPEIITGDDHREGAVENWALKAPEGCERYLFVEHSKFDKTLLTSVNPSYRIKTVLLADTFADVRPLMKYDNLLIIRKPLSVLNLGSLLNHNEITYRKTESNDLYDFTAESAKVLVVDDNIVNLTVAQGLLQPIKMQIDIASSAKEALKMIEITQYDIIFMDHMMPEMDGIEATHIIRRDYSNYSKTPIIALTANAMSGVKDMFISEGMNDFIAKPIEVRVLLDMLRRYLPNEKIIKGQGYVDVKRDNKDEGLVIADLDVKQAVSLLGSEALYLNILKVYYNSIESKAAVIKECFDNRDWKKYSVEVHALKSSSRQIGAMELGELAYTLEMAGKNEDIYLIERDTDKLLAMYLGYIDKLREYCADNTDSSNKPEADPGIIRSLFGRLRIAVDDLDMDEMENVIEEMSKYSYKGSRADQFESLKTAVANMDVEACILLMDNWN